MKAYRKPFTKNDETSHLSSVMDEFEKTTLKFYQNELKFTKIESKTEDESVLHIYEGNVKTTPFKCYKGSLDVISSLKKPLDVINKILSIYTDKAIYKTMEKRLKFHHLYLMNEKDSEKYEDSVNEIACCFAVNMGNYLFVKDRYFLDLRRKRSDEKVGEMYGFSIPKKYTKKHYPGDKSCVRGETKIWYLKVEKLDEKGKYNLQLMFHLDPLGWIPAKMFNSHVVDNCNVLFGYDKFLNDDK